MEDIINIPSLLTQFIIIAAIVAVLALITLRVIKVVFGKVLKSDEKIHVRYFEKLISFLIIFLAVSWVLTTADVTQSFGRLLFRGTTLLGAVVGLAAQPVISDIVCGFMISASKPFDIGDRIELSNGMAGIVRDITMRHTVLKGVDTIIFIIPNSELNDLTITNMSRGNRTRSLYFHFNVSYDTDVEMAQKVIYDAIVESEMTKPGKPGKDGKEDEYGPVYFMGYLDSALDLTVTVYYDRSFATEAVKNDINLRVWKALGRSGIEIPYPYTNVIIQNGNAVTEKAAITGSTGN